MKPEQCKERFDKNWSDRQVVNELFQLIERYVSPFSGEFFEDQFTEHQINWRKPELFDSTAVIAAQTLASSMQGALTNPAVKWFHALFEDRNLKEDLEAREWLELAENTVNYNIHNSNFNLEAAEFYLDLVTFGTTVMTEEYENDDVRYIATPLKEVYFDTTWDGKVLNFYQELFWSLDEILTRFGEDVKLPRKLEEVKNGDNQSAKKRKWKIIFCIFSRGIHKDPYDGKKKSPEKRPFGYYYILHNSAEVIGEEGGYYEMPAFVTRWRKTSRSQWGFSPATVCLADILTLNGITEVSLEALGKVVDPATLTTEFGLLSDLDLGRGGLTVVRSLDELAPYESRARFDVGELKIDNLQASINRAFFIDQLEMKQSPAMTAAEVYVRYELMQRLLGPTLGRLQNDFLNPMLERTFGILLREGKIPPPPPQVLQSPGRVAIEYTGPLARSQRMDVVQAVQQWVGGLVQLKEVRPDADDRVNYDEIALGTAEMLGVPAQFVNGPEEVAEIKQRRDAREAAAADAALAQQQGEAKKSLEEGKQLEQQNATEAEATIQ